MRTIKWELAAHAAVLVSALAILLCSCGGHHDFSIAPDVVQNAADAPSTLAETLKQLDALPIPAGVEAQQWVMLKVELRRLLTQGKSKFSSQAPLSSRSKVDDLTVTPSGGGNAEFHWTYRSEGDFNQNGLAGLDDLTPIGVHFGKDTTAADWNAAQVADGNRNGRIELGDLVSLGANFSFRVVGYHVQHSASGDPGGAWDTVADALFANSSITPGPWRTFSTQLAITGPGFYRVAPYDSAGEGVTGNIVYYSGGPIVHFETEDNDLAASADALPAFPIAAGTVTGNLGLGNLQGDDDGDFTDWFSVALAGAGELTLDLSHDVATSDLDLYLYEDPAGAPLVASETNLSPEHIQYTIPQAGTYYIRCAINTGYSEYVLECAFVPGEVNNPPQAQLTADPLSGEAPLSVSFDASASTDGDPGDAIVKYEFNFGDAAWFDSGADPTVTHLFSSPGAVTVAVRVTDGHGATDEASVPLEILPEGSGVWNVLIWMAADNNLATEAYGDIQRLETVGSTGNVRVLLGYDVASEWITGSGSEQVRFIRVVQDSDPQSINCTGDPANVSFAKAGYDSSHPQHVLEFLQWAQQFPAEHSLLVLWDHGDGWRPGWKEGASARSSAIHAASGLLKDDADGTAGMTNNKWIVDTLAAYHFDILLLDACNMGHLEAVYDFQALADHLLVSEAGLPAQGLPYDSILSAWNSGYPLAPDAICQLITDESYTMYNGVQALTLAVVDASAITPLIAACTDLASAIKAKAAQESLGVRRAISLACELRAGDGERDLHHFLTIYRALTADPAIQGLVDAALAQWVSAVTYFREYDYPGPTGLSVFLPGERFFGQLTRDEYSKTPFDQATGWLDTLMATGVPGQAGVPGVTADWAPGDRFEISWSDAAAEVDLGLQGPAALWASPVYPVELNGIIEFSADNPMGGATTEWAKLLPTAPTGNYAARLDWFSYGAGTPPALLDVAVKIYDSGGMLKQDLGTYQVVLGGEVSCAILSY